MDGNYELWTSDGTQEGTTKLTEISDLDGWVDMSAGFAHLDGFVYFNASNGTDGNELWRTDGTLAGTIRFADIRIDGSSNPYGFQTFKDTVFFFANDGEHGRELWKTNGTETVMVKDVNPEVEEGPYNGSDQLCGSSVRCYEGGGGGGEKTAIKLR